MYPRTTYEMTEKDLEKILDSCKPTPVMMIGSYTPATPQENANKAWKELGYKMGFDSLTVRPITNKGQRFFSAVPNETETQKRERENREARQRKLAEIEELKIKIVDLQSQLATLLRLE